MEKAQEILDFWFKEVGPAGWYMADDALDQKITDRFLSEWENAAAKHLDSWKADPVKSLAFIILVDQFPRNMFRSNSKAFSTDKLARCATRSAVEAKFDMRVPEIQRQFYYLPLMHSECLTDQERCVRLIKTRMPETGAQTLIHAKAHREIIRKFGRFPYRNEALARGFTPPETNFIQNNGYQKAIESFEAA